MAFIEAFLGAAVAGFGLLLGLVAAMAARRTSDRKMATLALAFVAAAVGGLALLASELGAGISRESREVVLALAVLVMLVLLYVALFLRRR